MNVVPLDSIETQLLALGVPDLDHIANGAFLRDGRFNGWPGGGVAGRHASIGRLVVWTYGNEPPPS
jgi:hypothetical protein